MILLEEILSFTLQKQAIWSTLNKQGWLNQAENFTNYQQRTDGHHQSSLLHKTGCILRICFGMIPTHGRYNVPWYLTSVLHTLPWSWLPGILIPNTTMLCYCYPRGHSPSWKHYLPLSWACEVMFYRAAWSTTFSLFSRTPSTISDWLEARSRDLTLWLVKEFTWSNK